MYEQDGALYRFLSEDAWKLVGSPEWSSFAQSLVESGKLVPFAVSDGEFSVARLQWITTPHEWSPRQLRSAALLTLDIQISAVQRGLSLKDASAFNVQFVGPKPIFIDHLSIERDPGTPWVAYRQFIEHFYAPLAIAEFVQPMSWPGIAGFSISQASAILGKRGRWNLGIQIHIHQLAKRILPGERSGASSLPQQPLNQRLAILQQLRDSIAGFKLEIPATDWGDYYTTSNYSPEQLSRKESLVASWLDEIQPRTAVDLGANDGKFSNLATERGANVLAIEADLEIVNRTHPLHAFTFISADLTAPTPGLGWQNQERAPLLQRARADTVIALAIIHHLVFTGQVPLDKVIDMIAGLGPNAVIEWIEPDDSYAQRLIGGRTSGLQPYSRELFESCVGQHYSSITSESIPGTCRTLFFCRR